MPDYALGNTPPRVQSDVGSGPWCSEQQAARHHHFLQLRFPKGDGPDVVLLPQELHAVECIGRDFEFSVHVISADGIAPGRGHILSSTWVRVASLWAGANFGGTIDCDETVQVKRDRTETVDHDETITIHHNRTARPTRCQWAAG